MDQLPDLRKRALQWLRDAVIHIAAWAALETGGGGGGADSGDDIVDIVAQLMSLVVLLRMFVFSSPPGGKHSEPAVAEQRAYLEAFAKTFVEPLVDPARVRGSVNRLP